MGPVEEMGAIAPSYTGSSGGHKVELSQPAALTWVEEWVVIQEHS